MKTLLHLLIVLSLLAGGWGLWSPCVAQTTDSKSSDNLANSHSIDERIADQVAALEQLQTLLSDDENLPMLADLFKQLPVNAENMMLSSRDLPGIKFIKTILTTVYSS